MPTFAVSCTWGSKIAHQRLKSIQKASLIWPLCETSYEWADSAPNAEWKQWTTALEGDLESLSLQRIFDCIRRRKYCAKISNELAQYRCAWNAYFRGLMNNTRPRWMPLQLWVSTSVDATVYKTQQFTDLHKVSRKWLWFKLKAKTKF